MLCKLHMKDINLNIKAINLNIESLTQVNPLHNLVLISLNNCCRFQKHHHTMNWFCTSMLMYLQSDVGIFIVQLYSSSMLVGMCISHDYALVFTLTKMMILRIGFEQFEYTYTYILYCCDADLIALLVAETTSRNTTSIQVILISLLLRRLIRFKTHMKN